MRTQKVEIREFDGTYREHLSLKKYKDLKKNYINYSLIDCIDGEKLPFRFMARDDNDAIECVKTLNWAGMHKLHRLNPNKMEGMNLVGIFLDRVWLNKD